MRFELQRQNERIAEVRKGFAPDYGDGSAARLRRTPRNPRSVLFHKCPRPQGEALPVINQGRRSGWPAEEESMSKGPGSGQAVDVDLPGECGRVTVA